MLAERIALSTVVQLPLQLKVYDQDNGRRIRELQYARWLVARIPCTGRYLPPATCYLPPATTLPQHQPVHHTSAFAQAIFSFRLTPVLIARAARAGE